MHLSIFYVLSFIFQHYMPVHVHGAICLDVFDGLVASSCRSEGWGRDIMVSELNVAAWA